MASKYAPLTEYLKESPTEELVELSFREIEGIIGVGLPPKARNTSIWWTNNRKDRGWVWLNANKKVDSVDITNGVVVFRSADIVGKLAPIK